MSVQYPVPDALGMPLKPSAVHDPAPTGGIGQVKYDPRSAPTRAKSSKWVESMLGRIQFNPPPTVQESIAASRAQPHVSSEAFRNIPPPHVLPPLSTPGIQPHQSQYHAGYISSDRVGADGQRDDSVGIRERPNNLVQAPGYHHAVRIWSGGSGGPPRESGPPNP